MHFLSGQFTTVSLSAAALPGLCAAASGTCHKRESARYDEQTYG